MEKDGAQRWSEVAEEWARYWGGFAAPARRALADAMGIGAGTRVLDVGCGSGEFLALLRDRGATAAGVDPAPRMLDLSRTLLGNPGVDLRLGDAEHLPWPDASFDAVTAVNALQFADDIADALAEVSRVTRPGGLLGIAGWDHVRGNDLDAIEAAIAAADGEGPNRDSDENDPDEDGLAQLLAAEGFAVLRAGVVEVPWEAADDDALVHGVLFGEDSDVVAETAPAVVAAARPFRTASGGYRLRAAFRWIVARSPH